MSRKTKSKPWLGGSALRAQPPRKAQPLPHGFAEQARYVTVLTVVELDPNTGRLDSDAIEDHIAGAIDAVGGVRFISLKRGVTAQAKRQGAEPGDW